MRARRFLVLALVAIALACGSRSAKAHATTNAYVEVDQVGPRAALVRLRVPFASTVALAWEGGCRSSGAREAKDPEGFVVHVSRVDCEGALRGASLTVEGFDRAAQDVAIYARFLDGSSASYLASATAPTWRVPAASSFASVFVSYVPAGFAHIRSGLDHLLFLVLLVLSLERAPAILAAETAFTLAHCATFSATALGLVHVPAAPTEACIALSLVLLATDAAGRARAPSRAPLVTAFVFGLVHGLGFAGGLRELGVPDGETAAALAGFGAGIELGQIAFLAVVYLACRALDRVGRLAPAARFAANAIGVVAAYWFFERTAALFHAA